MFTKKPAEKWDEAFPSGNGAVGVLAFGNPLKETLIFNHEKLFLPLPVNSTSAIPDISGILPALRNKIREGKYAEATRFCLDSLSNKGFPTELIWTDPFHPAFNLNIHIEQDGDIGDYRRWINFETGETGVEWKDNRGLFERKIFISRASNCAVLRLKAPCGSKLSCRLFLAANPGGEHIKSTKIRACCAKPEYNNLKTIETIPDSDAYDRKDSWLLFQSLYEVVSGGYDGIARIHTTGGKVKVQNDENGEVVLEDTDEAIILLKIVPFENIAEYNSESVKKEMVSFTTNYSELLESHTKVHGELFNRVRLDLLQEALGEGSNSSAKAGMGKDSNSNEELVELAGKGEIPLDFIQKMFDYGRYLLISSSGQLPPNLQGVWNGIWYPPWSSDYTLDENLQMMMWQVLPGNLPELAQSYFNLIESYIEDWKTNARLYYGCRGVLSSLRSTTSGLHKHFNEDYPMLFWTAGAGWLAQMFYDYWLFTGDREFLAKRAVPYLKEIVLFYEDFLIEGAEGKVEFLPSYSPENTPSNSDNPVAINATMDVAVAKEVLYNLIQACELLEIEQVNRPKWKELLNKMPEYLVNKDGAIKEWSWPGLEDDYHHRHSSHLYPVFPGFEVSRDETPELYQACLKAAELRLTDGIEAITGWGLAHLANISARLKDGELGYKALSRILRKFLLPNFFTCHNEGELFQMDANLGFTAAILEMLVFSKPGSIELLPALPKRLSKGTVCGMRCRNRTTLTKLQWDMDEKHISVNIKSDIDQRIIFKLPGEILSVEYFDSEIKIPYEISQFALDLKEAEGIRFEIRLLQV